MESQIYAQRFYLKRDSSDNDNECLLHFSNKRQHTQLSLDDDDEDAADKDNAEEDYFIDVPYSSSSIDRSSVGSIPWADDAIKQNQLDWERVERMLSGEEELLANEESELRNEILEWQRKFPQLLGKKSKPLQHQSFDSSQLNLDETLDIDSISHLSENSFDEEDDDDDFATPIPQRRQQCKVHTAKQQLRSDNLADLSLLLQRNLQVKSVPDKLQRRQQQQLTARIRNASASSASESSASTPVPQTPTPPPVPRRRLKTAHGNAHFVEPANSSPTLLALTKTASNSASATGNSLLRMPPILNVLESKRRFRGLTQNSSFVQLTQIQPANSAALTRLQQQQLQQPTRRTAAAHSGKHRNSWHMPLTAVSAFGGNFINNRNSIILPAIKLQHTQTQSDATNSSASVDAGAHAAERSFSTNSSLGSGGMLGRRTQFYSTTAQQQNFNGMLLNSTTTTPSTGRSISAAPTHYQFQRELQQPRLDFSAFYLPYSAAKFKSFK